LFAISGADERAAPRQASVGALQMLDVILLAMGLVFFALSVGYAYACDRL